MDSDSVQIHLGHLQHSLQGFYNLDMLDFGRGTWFPGGRVTDEVEQCVSAEDSPH